jgi:hypothetical protein
MGDQDERLVVPPDVRRPLAESTSAGAISVFGLRPSVFGISFTEHRTPNTEHPSYALAL